LTKLSITYDKYTWLPEAVIQQAIAQKWERSLSILIILRKTYKNPKFYNFSYRKVSKKTGLSISTLQRHIKKLTELGLVTMHNGNLCIVGSTKLRKSLQSPLIAVEYNNDKNKQILNIQFTRLLKNFRQQQYITNLKSEIIKLQEDNFISPKEAKKLIQKRNAYLQNTTPERTEDYYSISNKGLATLVNRRSITTGNKIQKKLNAVGLIKSEKNIEIVSKDKLNLRAFYGLCYPSNYFLGKDGLVRKRKPNKISIVCK